ncbi:uncharacterized protein TNCV_2092871 [Trichonephila clavipes]|nr:uncharacterized protein TNCV_2092871 [Trichonephila clavipes]
MRDKFPKETSSSKKSANGPDKISVYDSDVKDPSKYIGPIKVLFHIPHHTFTDQRCGECCEEVVEKGLLESRSPTFRIDSSEKDMRRTGFEGPEESQTI